MTWESITGDLPHSLKLLGSSLSDKGGTVHLRKVINPEKWPYVVFAETKDKFCQQNPKWAFVLGNNLTITFTATT